MKSHRSIIAIALLVLFHAPPPGGAEPVAPLVACVEESHRGMRDLSASFVQRTTIQAVRRSDTGKGTLLMKFGQGRTRFRFDYAKPKQSIVTDGTTLWYHQPELRQVLRTRLDRFLSGENSLALSYLGGMRTLSADFDAQRGGDDPAGNPRLILVPRKKGQLLRHLELTLSQASCDATAGGEGGRFPILSSVIVDQGGNRTELTYQKPVVNRGIPDASFVFTPPPGTTVIDQ